MNAHFHCAVDPLVRRPLLKPNTGLLILAFGGQRFLYFSFFINAVIYFCGGNLYPPPCPPNVELSDECHCMITTYLKLFAYLKSNAAPQKRPVALVHLQRLVMSQFIYSDSVSYVHFDDILCKPEHSYLHDILCYHAIDVLLCLSST